MKIIEKEIKIENENLISNNSLLFDIETTGFSRTASRIYLIGSLGKKNDKYIFRQYMTEKQADEKILIKKFANLMYSYENLISFNGDSFDLPFIAARAKRHSLNFDYSKLKSIDIYKIVKEKAFFTELENYKLKTLEKYLGIFREDIFSGGELIDLYFEYEAGKKDLENYLLLHNEEDILNLPRLFQLLEIINKNNTFNIEDKNFTVEKISLNRNKLEIFGSTNLKKAFLENKGLHLKVEDNKFHFTSLVNHGNYDNNTKCIYVEKNDLKLICNYKIKTPKEVYLLKLDKKNLNFNIRAYFEQVLLNIFFSKN